MVLDRFRSFITFTDESSLGGGLKFSRRIIDNKASRLPKGISRGNQDILFLNTTYLNTIRCD